MDVNAITPNDSLVLGENDSESIQNAISHAISCGLNSITIPRKNIRTGGQVWEISKAILLPSNFTIILSNCHLRLVDGVYDNIFRNENVYSDNACKKEGTQQGITIRGEGYAVLDGGKTNFLFENNYKTVDTGNVKAGMRVNNLILFHNVDGFVRENFEVRDMGRGTSRSQGMETGRLVKEEGGGGKEKRESV